MFPEQLISQYDFDTLRFQFGVLLPELLLFFLFIVILVIELFFKNNQYLRIPAVFLLGILGVGFLVIHQFLSKATPVTIFSGTIQADNLSCLFKIFFEIAAFILVLYKFMLSTKSAERAYFRTGEFYLVIMAALLGLHFLSMSVHFSTIYLSLELISIAGYLAVVLGKGPLSLEAGAKYLLYGAVTSAIMVYALSFFYGLTGSLELGHLVHLQGTAQVVVLFLILSAVFFKISAAPFHLWAPDVYEGSPAPLAAFLSIAPKAAGFLLLCRILPLLGNAGGSFLLQFQQVLAMVALCTLTIGNFSALWQKNAKRLLAYSSVAHTGFLLVGIVAGSQAGIRATVYYLFIYLFMNFVAFLMVDFFAYKVNSEDVHKFKGLGMKLPLLGIIFVVVMIALTGLPPTAGFYAKFFVFSALWESYHQSSEQVLLILLIFGIVNTVVSVFYYMKIPYLMFFKAGVDAQVLTTSSRMFTFFCLLTLPIVLLFFKPEWLMAYVNFIFN